jgi:hypothetical protein
MFNYRSFAQDTDQTLGVLGQFLGFDFFVGIQVIDSLVELLDNLSSFLCFLSSVGR